MTPTTSSGSAPVTGYRVWPVAIRCQHRRPPVDPRARCRPGTAGSSRVRLCWWGSRGSGRAVPTTRRGSHRPPASAATMCSRSRAVAECSTSCTGSMRSARSSRFDDWSNSQISQPNSFRYSVVDSASHRASGFGAGDREVLREQLAEHHLHHGRHRDREQATDAPRRPRSGSRRRRAAPRQPSADQRFGDVADEQAGDGDAELCAGEHERRAPGDGRARGPRRCHPPRRAP